MTRQRTGLHPTKLAAWRGFLEAHARLIDLLASELREETGLPLTWYDVLVHLSEAEDGQRRMQDLADSVLLSKSGLTRLIDRMEGEGLVERIACEEDRRGLWARLTDAGWDRLRATSPSHIDSVDRAFASRISTEEAEVLAEVFSRIADADTG